MTSHSSAHCTDEETDPKELEYYAKAHAARDVQQGAGPRLFSAFAILKMARGMKHAGQTLGRRSRSVVAGVGGGWGELLSGDGASFGAMGVFLN